MGKFRHVFVGTEKNHYVKRVTIIYLTFYLKVKNVFKRVHLTRFWVRVLKDK